jgi:hypothetical protein
MNVFKTRDSHPFLPLSPGEKTLVPSSYLVHPRPTVRKKGDGDLSPGESELLGGGGGGGGGARGDGGGDMI